MPGWYSGWYTWMEALWVTSKPSSVTVVGAEITVAMPWSRACWSAPHRTGSPLIEAGHTLVGRPAVSDDGVERTVAGELRSEVRLTRGPLTGRQLSELILRDLDDEGAGLHARARAHPHPGGEPLELGIGASTRRLQRGDAHEEVGVAGERRGDAGAGLVGERLEPLLVRVVLVSHLPPGADAGGRQHAQRPEDSGTARAGRRRFRP